jgi:uncharacterized membrane protein YtjA (UPF0391 family)
MLFDVTNKLLELISPFNIFFISISEINSASPFGGIVCSLAARIWAAFALPLQVVTFVAGLARPRSVDSDLFGSFFELIFIFAQNSIQNL